jgi:hypothetical protein
MKPTLSNLFCNPESSASEVDVLPTCCLVAATKIGRCFLLGGFDENQAVILLVGLLLAGLLPAVAKAVSGFRLATPKARMEYLGEISIIGYFWLLTVDL